METLSDVGLRFEVGILGGPDFPSLELQWKRADVFRKHDVLLLTSAAWQKWSVTNNGLGKFKGNTGRRFPFGDKSD